MRFHADELYLGTDVKWKVLSGFWFIENVECVALLVSDSAQSWNVGLTDSLKAPTKNPPTKQTPTTNHKTKKATQNQSKVCGDKVKTVFLSHSHRIPSAKN